MFRELEYQNKVFDGLQYYLDQLVAAKNRFDVATVRQAKNPDDAMEIVDFTRRAFDTVKKVGRLPLSRVNIPFSPRADGMGNPVPNITLKVPTGGGKTWLAVKSASMILNTYLGRNKGFILWIVPSEAIYSQTLKNLHNRNHAYRHALDRAAANKVKIFTKTDRLDEIDVRENLCVMVLMLQSSTRQNEATLKIFNDRGDVHGFFPKDGDLESQRALVKAIPNLGCYGGELSTVIRASLGNALRIIRPVVVIDEGHKAFTNLARDKVYGFNPSFVLELTATPKDVEARGGRNPRQARYANVLVEISGRELDAEGMIKMPINIDTYQGEDWKAVLNSAVDRLNALQKEARIYRAETNRYIRPILLVQVERTGKEQRSSSHIHAEDVKEWLMRTQFDEAEIAIKTAEQNDLAQDENQDLLSPMNQIRVIITKKALQEGWDCPFAYVLCSLAAQGNLSAMTQLVGRILRQPQAQKTGIEALDQCYVLTHRQQTGEIIKNVKKGLEGEGLGDLVVQVNNDDTAPQSLALEKIHRRKQFKGKTIFLPKVLAERNGAMYPLDYHTDILSKINWTVFDPKPVVDAIHKNRKSPMHQSVTIGISDDDGKPIDYGRKSHQHKFNRFDPVLAVQRISDIVLNPFVGYEIIENVLDALEAKGLDEDDLGSQFSYIVEVLRKELHRQQEKQAKDYFCQAVKKGGIQFRLRADRNNWKMPEEVSIKKEMETRKLYNQNRGEPLQRSLFESVFESELNKDERDVAIYLDEQETLNWWFRNVERKHYGIQGWRKGTIYPDFIFSLTDDGKVKKLVALETKGDHLEGNDDTVYKEEVMQFLTDNFSWDNTQPIGELTLENNGETVICDLVLMSEWKAKLPEKYFAQN